MKKSPHISGAFMMTKLRWRLDVQSLVWPQGSDPGHDLVPDGVHHDELGTSQVEPQPRRRARGTQDDGVTARTTHDCTHAVRVHEHRAECAYRSTVRARRSRRREVRNKELAQDSCRGVAIKSRLFVAHGLLLLLAHRRGATPTRP